MQDVWRAARRDFFRRFAVLAGGIEHRERELLSEDAFEKMMDTVGGFERALGIHDLAKFTPAPGDVAQLRAGKRGEQ